MQAETVFPSGRFETPRAAFASQDQRRLGQGYQEAGESRPDSKSWV